MSVNTLLRVNYVDSQGYEILYCPGEYDLGVLTTGGIYHVFNGLMLMAVI